jgi:uncharacterized protein (TIGR00730 family)
MQLPIRPLRRCPFIRDTASGAALPPVQAPNTRLDILKLVITNVAIFCASANGTTPIYRESAAKLGRILAQQNIGIIYGGANVGLMQALAESSLATGGRVVGVIPEVLVDLEVAHRGLSELHVTTTMHTRKAMMGDLADAFLILPGGFGTFEEMFEVLAWQTLKLHQKPIVLININGFYNKLLDFLDHCVAEGLLKQRNRDNLLVANSVENAMAQLSITSRPTLRNG